MRNKNIRKAAPARCAVLCFFLCLAPCAAEDILFNADSMTGNTSKEAQFTRLTGHAHIKTDTLEISADDILLDGDDFRYITATGNVIGSNSEAGFDFTCRVMKYDRTTKTALLERDVTLDDAAHGVKAKAQLIEYRQDTETAVMQIDVNITQKKSVCTAALAVYRKADQMLELAGNPKVVQEKDTFIAQEITLNLDTEEISLDGKVRGTVTSTDTPESAPEDQPPASDDEAAPAEQDRTSASEQPPVSGTPETGAAAETAPDGNTPPEQTTNGDTDE